MKINNATIERAITFAEKDGQVITKETAEGYFMAALAHEMELINWMLNTKKGSTAAAMISNKMSDKIFISKKDKHKLQKA